LIKEPKYLNKIWC